MCVCVCVWGGLGWWVDEDGCWGAATWCDRRWTAARCVAGCLGRAGAAVVGAKEGGCRGGLMGPGSAAVAYMVSWLVCEAADIGQWAGGVTSISKLPAHDLVCLLPACTQAGPGCAHMEEALRLLRSVGPAPGALPLLGGAAGPPLAPKLQADISEALLEMRADLLLHYLQVGSFVWGWGECVRPRRCVLRGGAAMDMRADLLLHSPPWRVRALAASWC